LAFLFVSIQAKRERGKDVINGRILFRLRHVKRMQQQKKSGRVFALSQFFAAAEKMMLRKFVDPQTRRPKIRRPYT
jgi:hypothetical protein